MGRPCVDPVAHAPGDLGHLRTEGGDDDGRFGIRKQEPRGAPCPTQLRHALLDLLASLGGAEHGPSDRFLLTASGDPRMGSSTEAEQEASIGAPAAAWPPSPRARQGGGWRRSAPWDRAATVGTTAASALSTVQHSST